MPQSTDRRTLLKGLGSTAAIVTVAGCEESGDSTNENGDTNTGGGSNDGGDTDTAGGSQVELVIQTSESPQIYRQISNLLTDQWEQLGISSKINVMPGSRSIELQRNNEDDSLIAAWDAAPERIDPDFLLSLKQSENSVYNDGAAWPNLEQFMIPEYDEAYQQQAVTLDREERREYVYRCQEILAKYKGTLSVVTPDLLQGYNESRWNNMEAGLADGFISFHNFLQIEPTSSEVDTLRVGNKAKLDTLNPTAELIQGVEKQLKLIYGRLFRVNTLENGRPDPWMVSDYEEEDSTTIHMTLRDDLSFHDGEPVTAEDVRFSIDFYKEYAAFYDSVAKPIDSVEVHNDLEFTLNLVNPHAPLYANVLGRLFILPKHVWEDVPDEVGAENVPEYDDPRIGSGPLKFVSHEPGERLVLERNDDHFNPPNFESYVSIPGDEQSHAPRLETGELDILGSEIEINPQTAENLRQAEGVAVEKIPYPSVTWVFLGQPDVYSPPLDHMPLRDALAHTVPRQQIIDVLYQGNAHKNVAYLPVVNEYWYNDEIPEDEHDFDLEKARSILEEAGYTWDDDGNLIQPADYTPWWEEAGLPGPN